MNWLKWVGWIGGILFLWLSLTGCSSMQAGNRMMDAMAQAATTLSEKIRDEGVLQQWMIDADGNVQNPGVESYVTLTLAGGVHATGINGSIVARGSGDSTRLPSGVREELVKQLSGPISDAQRTAILTILGWNRTTTTISVPTPMPASVTIEPKP